MLRDQATRPNPGTFDAGPSPFRSGGGDTIDADGGVNLQRTGGVVDDTAAGSASASGTSAGAPGAGLGTISSAADPTGIAPTAGAAGGTPLDPAQILGAGTSSTGSDTVSAPNDPTGIAPGTLDQLGDGRLGGGTRSGSDSDTGTDVFGPTDTGSDTGTEPGTDTPTDTTTGTDDVLASTTLTGTRTGTTTGGGTGLGGGTTLFGEPTTASTSRVVRAPRDPDGGRTVRRTRDVGFGEQADDEEERAVFATDADSFGSGIASAEEAADGLGDAFRL